MSKLTVSKGFRAEVGQALLADRSATQLDRTE